MLDELLEIFERDKKKPSGRSSVGLRGRLARVLEGDRDDDRRYDDRYRERDRYDDRDRGRDDDDRYRSRDRNDDRYRTRDRDDDDRFRNRDHDDDDRYDGDGSFKRKKKREFDFLDFGD